MPASTRRSPCLGWGLVATTIPVVSRNLAIWVAFDGTDFHGWQRQPGLRTVQQVLEETLQRAIRHPVDLTACGRTDSGVHAAAHVSNFRTDCNLPVDKLLHSFGSHLPDDIGILAVRDVAAHFHATRSAIAKCYRYRIHASQRRPVASLTQRFTHHQWVPLDVDAMRAAARHFIGEHDFTSLAATGTRRETMVRSVFRCDVERHLDEIHVNVEGDGFLWKQVRAMVGTLIQVGVGHWPADDVAAIIAARDRSRAGPTMPAKGLCLQWVRYPPEVLATADRT